MCVLCRTQTILAERWQTDKKQRSRAQKSSSQQKKEGTPCAVQWNERTASTRQSDRPSKTTRGRPRKIKNGTPGMQGQAGSGTCHGSGLWGSSAATHWVVLSCEDAVFLSTSVCVDLCRSETVVVFLCSSWSCRLPPSPALLPLAQRPGFPICRRTKISGGENRKKWKNGKMEKMAKMTGERGRGAQLPEMWARVDRRSEASGRRKGHGEEPEGEA